MRKIVTLLIAVISISTIACGKNEPETPKNEPEAPAQEDEYYIQYSSHSTKAIVYVTVLTPDGQKTITVSRGGHIYRSWVEVYGPVSKGFNTRISVNTGDPYNAKTTIHISKNGGPFTLKASGTTGASYTIDF